MSLSLQYQLASLIRAELRAQEISQAEFCRRAGTSTKHLNRVLQGANTASVGTLEYWAFLLGKRFVVTIADLAEGVGE